LASALVAAPRMARYCWLPSATLSSTPRTVTVCGAAQLAVVKTSEGCMIVPSPGSLLESGMVTVAVPLGCDVRRTVKVVVVPSSRVLPAAALTVIPALSLSVLVTETSMGLREL